MHILLIDGQYLMSCMQHKINFEHGDGAGNDLLILASISFIDLLIKSNEYSHILLCLDDPSRSFRREIHPSYKENRISSLSITTRIPMYIRSINSMGVRSKFESGHEASDIMASIMSKAAHLNNVKLTAITNDKRLYPYLCQGMTIKSAAIFDSNKPRVVTLDTVERNFGGLSKKQLVGALSLIGDPKRGIPGVTGIGVRKSCTFMRNYEDIYGIMSNRDETQKLISSSKGFHAHEDLKLSYELTILNSKIPLGFSLSEIRIGQRKQNTLTEGSNKLKI